MTLAALAASFLAGALYVLSPGPAVLALIGIGASQGRRPAAHFVIGHLAGDTLWCGLAIFALVGAQVIDQHVFDAIALLCAGYLGWLGYKGVTARSAGAADDVIGRRPLRRGILFGLTNPKSYPVALAMFSALFAGQAGTLSFEALPMLLIAAFVGFLIGDLILVWIVGTKLLRGLYLRHALWIIRATGALFLLFSLRTAWEALPRLLRR
ncbi:MULTISPECIES: LysE family translocator [Hyphomicrobiales]|jgi:threonine/homoserine/homoserine lactone efflux protein|uniref:Lysine transporter LysE n=2 Tax=Prosthecodimorpha TaxID=2981530 RepID=A0A0P6WED0_9HYPH|nr:MULTISPECIES: LysE family translocator [Hyphomicrobiales]KPL54807.1 lysine transporter LysE [Prosthecomicrobium hirschii]MBT9290205.1 LysE family translocator [Prosthecodimorpha staleyi]MCW1840305.1 LysE family translocator [Prosthecomicrobium hirschii]TPQ50688.1 LysE family translocator [Prosthecomicrobium hirschii]